MRANGRGHRGVTRLGSCIRAMSRYGARRGSESRCAVTPQSLDDRRFARVASACALPALLRLVAKVVEPKQRAAHPTRATWQPFASVRRAEHANPCLPGNRERHTVSKARLSRSAAVVVMTTALAWNLPVMAQDDAEDSVSVTVVSDTQTKGSLTRSEEPLRTGEAAPLRWTRGENR